MNKPALMPHVNPTAFSITPLSEADDDKAYWRSK